VVAPTGSACPGQQSYRSIANKLARIDWAVLSGGKDYQHQQLPMKCSLICRGKDAALGKHRTLEIRRDSERHSEGVPGSYNHPQGVAGAEWRIALRALDDDRRIGPCKSLGHWEDGGQDWPEQGSRPGPRWRDCVSFAARAGPVEFNKRRLA